MRVLKRCLLLSSSKGLGDLISAPVDLFRETCSLLAVETSTGMTSSLLLNPKKFICGDQNC